MIESILESWMSPDLMQRFAGSILHFVWQGALIAMIAAVVLRLLANRSAQSRYSISVVALFLMLAAPVLTFVIYERTGQAALNLLRFISKSVISSSQATTHAAATAGWTQWIVLAWFVGVLLSSIRLVAGWRMSRTLTRTGTSTVPDRIQKSFNEIRAQLALTMPVRLLASLRIETPVAVGWLRPVVLLPIVAISGLDEYQLRAILAHELAHIRRHDFLVNLLQRGVESILFYHPAVWWLSSRIRSEREHCCDDLAVQICGDRSAYAKVLIELERVRSVDPALAVALTGGKLTQRIHRILGYRIANYDWQSAAAALMFVVVWVMVGAWQSDRTLDAGSLAPRPIPTPIEVKALAPTPKLAGAVSALAAIVTAQPVQSTSTEKGVVEGVLRDSSGTPEAGVRVAAMALPTDLNTATSTTLAGITQTDANGRYRLEGIPAGRYYITAGRVEFPTFYPGTLDVDEGKVVTVSGGTTIPNINFAMEILSKVGRSPSVLTVPNLNPGVAASLNPGVLNLYVSIQVEGGGKYPVFADGHSPKLRLTNIDTNISYEMWFAFVTISVPRNLTTTPSQYKVAVEDLPDGYAVKGVTYWAHEPGVRFVDVLSQPLKISMRENYETHAGVNGSTGAPDLPIAITLVRRPVPTTSGVRVTGSTGMVARSALPVVGAGNPDPGRTNPDAGVYISGKPGILYNDGTFEFVGIAPGLHTIVQYPGRLATQVIVRNRDVEGIALQDTSLLPKTAFSRQEVPPDAAAATVAPRSLLTGRVLDESTQQPINFGYITLRGYFGSTRQFVGFGKETFSIPDLLPGPYSLTVEGNGYKSKTQQITVSAQKTSVEMKVTPEPK